MIDNTNNIADLLSQSEVPTRSVKLTWLLITRAPLTTSLATDISYSDCYLTVTLNWLCGHCFSIFPCVTKFNLGSLDIITITYGKADFLLRYM